MKASLFAIAFVAANAAFGTPAQAQNYPWCALYDSGNNGMNCGFATYQQCMADVSGIGGFCERNNTYVPPRAAASAPRTLKHRARTSS